MRSAQERDRALHRARLLNRTIAAGAVLASAGIATVVAIAQPARARVTGTGAAPAGRSTGGSR
jgi:hypothetical protein